MNLLGWLFVEFSVVAGHRKAGISGRMLFSVASGGQGPMGDLKLSILPLAQPVGSVSSLQPVAS